MIRTLHYVIEDSKCTICDLDFVGYSGGATMKHLKNHNFYSFNIDGHFRWGTKIRFIR